MVQVIVIKSRKSKQAPQMLVPPTPERAKQEMGIREVNHRFAAVEPFEWLYERNVFGHKDGIEAQERLQAAKRFLFLYVINEEQPTRYAMLDWSKFILGIGSLNQIQNSKEDHKNFIIEKREEYNKICKALKQRSYGHFGLLVIKRICATAQHLGDIERHFHWPKGMGGIILRQTLDDINKIIA